MKIKMSSAQIFESIPVIRQKNIYIIVGLLLASISPTGATLAPSSQPGSVTDTKKSAGSSDESALNNGGHRGHSHYIYQREFSGDDWLNSLIWNLIGYSTILVPGIFIIRMAKYSNFNERNGEHYFFKKVYSQCLIPQSVFQSYILVSLTNPLF